MSNLSKLVRFDKDSGSVFKKFSLSSNDCRETRLPNSGGRNDSAMSFRPRTERFVRLTKPGGNLNKQINFTKVVKSHGQLPNIHYSQFNE